MRDPTLRPTAASAPPSHAWQLNARNDVERYEALQAALLAAFAALPSQTQASLGPPSISISSSTSYLSSRHPSHYTLPPPPSHAPHPQHTPIQQRSSHYEGAPRDQSSSRSSPPSLPPLHRVYSLRCASCDLFLTDRGMRAVLLLRPSIVLFSTDAGPCNAGPLWPDLAAATTEGSILERTCNCLTSSLGCFGCGAVVGYHIIQPCDRCTASVARHQRTASNHRYVFHHHEISSTERIYFPGEPGIVGTAYRPSREGRWTQRSPSHTPTPASPERQTMDVDAKEGPAEFWERARDRRLDGSPGSSRGGSPPVTSALIAGDLLYWHNLVSGGERWEPVDPRMRTRGTLVVERPGR